MKTNLLTVITSLAWYVAMPSIIEDTGKYVIGILIGAAALVVVNWLNSPTIEEIQDMMEKRTPTMEQIKNMMEKESPWVRERMLIISRLDAMERADASLSVRIDAVLSKLDGIQTKSDGELRNIHHTLYQIIAKLDLLDEPKKKDGHGLP